MQVINHYRLTLGIVLAVILHVGLLINFESIFVSDDVDLSVEIDLVANSGAEKVIPAKAVDLPLPLSPPGEVPGPVEKIAEKKAALPLGKISKRIQPDLLKNNKQHKGLSVIGDPQMSPSLPAAAEVKPLTTTKPIPADSSGAGGQPVLSSRQNIVNLVLAAVNGNKRYPQRARRRGWEGLTEWNLVVDPQGEISQLAIYRSSGRKILDRAAQQAIRRSSPIAEVKTLIRDPVAIRLAVSFQLQ